MLREKSTHTGKLRHELPCPHCGYDLRGAPAVDGARRCPECGLEVLGDPRTLRSRIPWVHRREIGRFRAYWQTVWWVILNSPLLAREIDRPIVLRDARRFYWTSLVAASLIATVLISTAANVEGGLSLGVGGVPPMWATHLIYLPAFVLADHWTGVPVLALGIGLALRLIFQAARSILITGMPPGIRQARLWRATLYMAGLAPVVALAAGAMVLLRVLADNLVRVDHWGWVAAALCVLWGFMLTFLYLPPVRMILAVGALQGWRVFMFIVLMPLVIWAAMGCVVVAVSWVAGYVVMAARSMTI